MSSHSGESHAHHHNHDHRPGIGRLYMAAAVLLVVAAAEVIGGVIANSLALLSDAGHMFTDILAIGIAIFAAIISRRAADDTNTYGYHRAEIIAAFINGIILASLTLWILYEGIVRLLHPEPVNAPVMLIIGIIGLLANIAGAWLLHGDHGDMNTRAAFLHILGDLLSSVAVILGAVAIWLFKIYYIDPVLSVLIAMVILRSSYSLITQAVDILMEQSPEHIDTEELKRKLLTIPGINNIHHVHLWTIGSYRYAMSAHIDVDNIRIAEGSSIISEVNTLLSREYHIEYVTVQLECSTCSDMRNLPITCLVNMPEIKLNPGCDNCVKGDEHNHNH